MNEKMERVLQKWKKGIRSVTLSDPLSIRFWASWYIREKIVRSAASYGRKHTMFLNYLYYVSDTGFEKKYGSVIWMIRLGF